MEHYIDEEWAYSVFLLFFFQILGQYHHHTPGDAGEDFLGRFLKGAIPAQILANARNGHNWVLSSDRKQNAQWDIIRRLRRGYSLLYPAGFCPGLGVVQWVFMDPIFEDDQCPLIAGMGTFCL